MFSRLVAATSTAATNSVRGAAKIVFGFFGSKPVIPPPPEAAADVFVAATRANIASVNVATSANISGFATAAATRTRAAATAATRDRADRLVAAAAADAAAAKAAADADTVAAAAANLLIHKIPRDARTARLAAAAAAAAMPSITNTINKADAYIENAVTVELQANVGSSIHPTAEVVFVNEKLSNTLALARDYTLSRETTRPDVMKTAAENAASFAHTVTAVTDIARKENNIQNVALTKNNNTLAEFELQIKELYDAEAAAKLEALREELVARAITTDNFRSECVIAAVEELDAALHEMCPTLPASLPDECSLVMVQIAESWSPYLSCPINGDATVDRNNKIFFTRTSQAVDALCSRCVFFSENWVHIPAHIAPLTYTPSTTPPPPDYRYPMVPIGPYRYVIGPILDFQNIQGRIFIYIKCYSDAAYTKGTYFWVYRSQSEGLFRVFFKVDPYGPIEKGYDYTQATLVHFILQIFLCNYYELHKRRGARDPIEINTLGRLNYFMKKMNSLQAGDFLDNFPGEAIRPSVYSIVCVTGDNVPAGVACPRASEPGCYYVCLTPQYVPLPSPPPQLRATVQSPGMIGHYYVIDAKFASIISRGFPIDPPDVGDSLWYNPAIQSEWELERDANFPALSAPHAPPPYYDFSRRRHGYQRTHPYICCFTTCCMVQPCSSFDRFLDINNYKNTFWCQGFENYTEILSRGLSREILSPVLYVLIGALLQDSDMTLLTLRNNILNTNYNPAESARYQNIATNAFMTLGTREYDLDPATSLYLPGVPEYIRQAALMAYEKIREINRIAYESFKTQIRTNQHREEQKAVVLPKVEKKSIW
jgi:hypothetical protein